MLTDSNLFRRVQLQLLMNLTARAFGRKPLRIWTLPCGEALHVYAAYTRDLLLTEPDEVLLGRMNEEAYSMGRRLRRLFRIKSQAAAERLVVQLYRNIGICLEGHIPGQLCFRRCFFSRYYTPAVCKAASALDDGIVRGLSGCGPLHFEQRITEGCSCCLARTEEAVEKI